MRSTKGNTPGFLLLLFSLVSMLHSCREKADAELRLSIHYTWNSDDFKLMHSYMLMEKRVEFEQVKFYMCRFYLQSESNSIGFFDEYMLFDAAQSEPVTVGKVEPGSFSSFGFSIGVDSSRNTQNGSLAIPAWEYPSTHPLSAAQEMYWAWNPGYIFLKIEGRIDIDENGAFDGVGETFSIHTGLNPGLRSLSRTGTILVESGGPHILELNFDIAKVFDGYSLSGAKLNVHPLHTQSTDFMYAQQIMDNVEAAFVGWTMR